MVTQEDPELFFHISGSQGSLTLKQVEEAGT